MTIASKPVGTPHSAQAGLAEVSRLLRQGRWGWPELVFWAGAAGIYVLFPSHLVLASQVLIAGLFAMSLDLIVGYAGRVSLGHAAFFGIGAYGAGLLSQAGWGEPIIGLLVSMAVAGLAGYVCSLVLVRVHEIALLMITLGIGLLLYEFANKAAWLTGGDDGLQGIAIGAVLGTFGFDLFGRTAYLYTLAAVFVCFCAARRVVTSPFGLALRGIQGNSRRMPALGASVAGHLRTVYTMSAALAGAAGALLCQTSQFVSLDVLSFQRSAEVLIMLILGGAGRLYGAFVGAAAFMVAREMLASANPVYWFFWLGLMLVLVVMFARDGILGGVDRVSAALRRRTVR